MKQRLLDLLAMGRVANLPTVVSNVLLGCGLGIFTGNFYSEPPVLLFPALAGCFLYLGGCFLNDWMDADWDARHRPERAIPAGRVPQRVAGFLAVSLLLAGISLAGLINPAGLFTAAALAAFVVIYTWLHKRTAWAVIPMGLCRALLYVLGFVAQTYSLPEDVPFGFPANPHLHDTYTMTFLGIIPFSGSLQTAELISRIEILVIVGTGLLSYIAGLSLLARHEAAGNLPRTNKVCAILLIFVPVMTHSLIFIQTQWLATVAAGLPFVVLATVAIRLIGRSLPKGVSLLLALIALIDLIVAVPLCIGSLSPALGNQHEGIAILFPLAAAAAFLLALLLQKIAPAT